LALGRPVVAQSCGVLVENTITAFEARPANVPELTVPATSVAAPALVVVKGIVELLPSLQVTVAVPDEEPLPQPSDPVPEAETEPPVIPATPWQRAKLPENV
jgi:hypothetical protein